MFYTRALKPVLESATELEREYIVWARLRNSDVLKGASKSVIQEQVSVQIPKTDNNLVGGVLRVRKTTDINKQVSYTLTLKQKHVVGTGQPLNTESNVEVDADFYTQLAGIAETLVIKHRYYFPIEGTDLEWEVDAGPDTRGGYHDWVRLELEVPSADFKLPALPFDTEETILPLEVQAASGVEVDEVAYRERTDALFKGIFEYSGPLTRYVNQE